MMTDLEVLKRVAKNARAVREAQKLSLAEVGRRCGTYASTIKEIESGNRMPGLGTALRLAESLGCPLSTLIAPPNKHARAS